MPNTSASSSGTGSPPTDGSRRVVLLGHGISYSASPAMQNAGFRAAGLDWTYELLDVAPGELPAAVGSLRRAGAAGANVTIPHKLAVMRLVEIGRAHV